MQVIGFNKVLSKNNVKIESILQRTILDKNAIKYFKIN